MWSKVEKKKWRQLYSFQQLFSFFSPQISAEFPKRRRIWNSRNAPARGHWPITQVLPDVLPTMIAPWITVEIPKSAINYSIYTNYSNYSIYSNYSNLFTLFFSFFEKFFKSIFEHIWTENQFRLVIRTSEIFRTSLVI